MTTSSENGDLPLQLVKITRAKPPLVVLLENVEGFFHTSKYHQKTPYEILEDRLRPIGYTCTCEMYEAWWFGLPQKPKRWFIVALRDNINVQPFAFPVAPPSLRTITLRSILLDPSSYLLDNNMYNVDAQKCPILSVEGVPELKPDQWEDMVKTPPSWISMSELHTTIRVGLVAKKPDILVQKRPYRRNTLCRKPSHLQCQRHLWKPRKLVILTVDVCSA